MLDNDKDDSDTYQRSSSAREERYGQELLRKIDFGIQVQSFLDSQIGQRILADAETELQSLYRALADVDPEDESGRTAYRTLKHRIGVLSHWQDCFAAYIIEGRNAEIELQERESTE